MSSNQQRITKGFQILTRVLAPYVAGTLREEWGDQWWRRGVFDVFYDHRKRDLPPTGTDGEVMKWLDHGLCFLLMDIHWNDLFRSKLSRDCRTWIKELSNTRNKWAHPGFLDPSDDDTWRALDTMARLADRVEPDAATRLRALARTVRYGNEGPSTATGEANTPKLATPPRRSLHQPAPQATRTPEASPAASGVLTDVPRSGLKSWREVARPHPDVAAGRYRQAEFAADLAQVVNGTAEAEYQDPVEFFSRTYLTEGMRGLLRQTLQRLHGHGGEPVIQLKTAFGGGKTHSLLALWHLVRGHESLHTLPGVAQLLRETGLERLPQARVAAIVGTSLNPTKERRPPHLPKIVIRTLWGEIGAQLAHQAGDLALYDHVRDADRKGVPPGSEALRTLFDACGPCLVLIDELVAYARKIYGVAGLPAGSFDALQTFVQELTEAARASRNTAVVATIPESDEEVGGKGGQEALKRMEHTFGRMEAIWKPVGAEEGFEVVRRRLFLDVEDQAAQVAKEQVCSAFSRLYREESNAFPSECREEAYLQRLRSCYPIHPEVFDRLYGDWATLERFQRTRGVLRLMAAVIHDLWSRNDANLLIQPGAVGLDSSTVREELTRYLPNGWNAVVETDVDGKKSLPRRTDMENPRFDRSLAARRVARSLFLGSAPHVGQQQVRGLENTRIRLGVVQPGEAVSTFNDALSQLSDKLTYLYRKGERYWYDTRPNLRRTVEDRAQQLPESEIHGEILKRVREAVRGERGHFKGVHPCPAGPGDVPDQQETRLVLLSPDKTHQANNTESPALLAAADILERRGSSPRQHRNTLLFLAPDQDAMDSLRQEVRRFLAWQSVVRDHEALNLDGYQRREAVDGQKASNDNVQVQFGEAWRWLLAPTQPAANPSAPMEWDVTRASGNGKSMVTAAADRMQAEQHLIVKWSPALLRMELDRWFWKDAEHVSLKAVWDALTAYPYLSRLQDQNVLIQAIQEGSAGTDYFAYATSQGDNGRYEGLRFGAPAPSVHIDGLSLLVKPDRARAQMEAEQDQQPKPQPQTSPPVTGGGNTRPAPQPRNGQPPQPQLARRFFGNIEIDPDRAGRDMGKVAQEILQHLTTLRGAKVKVTVEIEAEVADGLPGDIQRVLDENCRTLRFKDHGFERS